MKEDWQHPENESILWNIGTGEVLLAQGAMTLDEIRRKGVPYEEFRKRR